MIDMDEFVSRAQKIAGRSSFWRGFDYYEAGCVLSLKKIDDTHYEALVEGSLDEPYKVILDTEHLRFSECNCPFTDEHPRRFCKHKVAVYLAIYQDEYKKIKEIHDYRNKLIEEEHTRFNNELDKASEEIKEDVIKMVSSMSDEEVRSMLIRLLTNDRVDSYESFLKSSFGYDYDDEDDYYW